MKEVKRMNLAKSYGHLVKKNMDNPNSALTLIKIAALLEHTKWSKFPDKNLPKSLQYLYEIMFKYTLEPLQNPKKSAFVNLFAPCEILHAFEIYPLFIEAMATLGQAFNFESYSIVGWIFQACLVIICIKLSTEDWTEKTKSPSLF